MDSSLTMIIAAILLQCIIHSNPVTIVATINSTAVNILEHVSLYKLVLVHPDP